jgi:hypothetical protein
MRAWSPILASLVLLGCHARFKRHAPDLAVMRAEVITLAGPDVDLGRVGGGTALALAYDIGQTLREAAIERSIAEKVDAEQVNDAFLDGFAATLGDGPPFAFDPDAPHVLRFELVDWGLESFGWGIDGRFNYDLIVHGYRSDGRKIYRARFSCQTGAGAVGWTENLPVAGPAHPDRIRNLDRRTVQAIFDEAARDCGRQVVERMRYHAG